jgi:hypothetical protein
MSALNQHLENHKLKTDDGAEIAKKLWLKEYDATYYKIHTIAHYPKLCSAKDRRGSAKKNLNNGGQMEFLTNFSVLQSSTHE